MKTLKEVRAEYEATLAEDAKDRAGKIRINGAKIFLKAAIAAGEFEGDIKEAVAAVSGAFSGRSTTSPRQIILNKLVEAGSMTNMECFTEFDKGPSEMRDLMRHAIKDVAPEDRVWIEYTADKVYNVVATGADAPEGWVGYMPALEDEDL